MACMHVAYISVPMTELCKRVICVQTQDEDDGDDETSGQDFMELIHLTRRHISEAARLEGLREVEVEVTATTHKDLVLRVRAPALCEDGELLWSPLERVQRPRSSNSRKVW